MLISWCFILNISLPFIVLLSIAVTLELNNFSITLKSSIFSELLHDFISYLCCCSMFPISCFTLVTAIISHVVMFYVSSNGFTCVKCCLFSSRQSVYCLKKKQRKKGSQPIVYSSYLVVLLYLEKVPIDQKHCYCMSIFPSMVVSGM